MMKTFFKGFARAFLVWLMAQGLPMLLYVGIGIGVYGQLEGWNEASTVYFLVVTATTVGYGDLCPETPAGRLFTCLYSLVGIIVLMSAMAPIVEWILEKRKWIDELIEESLEAAGIEEDQDASVSVEDARLAALVDADGDGVVTREEAAELAGHKFNYTFKYLRALSGPFLVFLIGLGLGLGVLGLNIIDAIYFTVITMTTIGYGDMSFIAGDDGDEWVQWVGVLYLPLAVTALADAVSEFSRIAVRKNIRSTNYEATVDQLLLDEAKGNPHEKLTEAEFLISVLKSHDIIDDATLRTIRIQFARLTSHCTFEKDEVPVLDARAVFESLKSQGRIVDKSALGALDEDAVQRLLEKAGDRPLTYINLSHADGGFQEWHKKHWLPRVLGYEHDAGMEEEGVQQPIKPFDMKTPAFQVIQSMKTHTDQGARLPSPAKNLL